MRDTYTNSIMKDVFLKHNIYIKDIFRKNKIYIVSYGIKRVKIDLHGVVRDLHTQ